MLKEADRRELLWLSDEMRWLYMALWVIADSRVPNDRMASISEAELRGRLRDCARWMLDVIGAPAELPLLAPGESRVDLYTLSPAVTEENHACAQS